MSKSFYKLKIFYLTLMALMLVVITGCTLSSGQSNRAENSRFREKIGDRLFSKLSNPKQVSVAKVQRTGIGLTVIPTEQRVLTWDKVQSLKQVLLQDSSYFFDKTKKCLFIPDLVFKFNEVDVLVGLSCKQIKIQEGGESVILDYDPASGVFIPLCKEILDQLEK